jgi:hypothetical protein
MNLARRGLSVWPFELTRGARSSSIATFAAARWQSRDAGNVDNRFQREPLGGELTAAAPNGKLTAAAAGHTWALVRCFEQPLPLDLAVIPRRFFEMFFVLSS